MLVVWASCISGTPGSGGAIDAATPGQTWRALAAHHLAAQRSSCRPWHRANAPRIQRMPYDYTQPDITQPSPEQVRAARLAAGQTQLAAAATVHKVDPSQWRAWERSGPSGRVIDRAIWELYLIKTGLRENPCKNKSCRPIDKVH